MNTAALDKLAATWKRSFKTKPRLSLIEWAEKNVYLDSKSTAEVGPWRLAKTPWIRRVMEAAEDRSVRTVVFPKSSRCGATEGIFCVIRSMPSRNPGHVACVFTNANMARDVNTRRMRPTLEHCAAPYLTGNPDDFGMSKIRLTNMDITFAGSESDSWGTEVYLRTVFLDEYDSHKPGGEQTNLALAESRIRNVVGGKVFAVGKCKLKGGPLHSEYCAGTQERPMVPCPHCGALIEFCEHGLKFGHLKRMDGTYDEQEVIDGTRYVCPGCEAELTEGDKRRMVTPDLLEFIPAPDGPLEARRAKADRRQHFDPRHPMREGGKAYKTPLLGRVSLRISDFYCLHDDMTWGHMALKIIAASTNPQMRKDLVIEHFGTGYGEATNDAEEGDVLRARGDYLRGELPWAPAIFSLQADMQEHSIKWAKTAFGETGEMAVIDWGEITDHDFRALDQILDAEHKVKDADETRAVEFGRGLIDSRYEEDLVFSYCRASNFRLYPAKGVKDTPATPFCKIKWKDWGDEEIGVYHFNDHAVKSELYTKRLVGRKDPKIWFPSDVGADFVAELVAERLERKPDKFGMPVYAFVKRGAKNDWGDCVKMGIIVWRESERELRERAEEEKEAAESGDEG